MLIKYFSLDNALDLAQSRAVDCPDASDVYRRAIDCWSRYYIDRDSLVNQIKKLLGG